MIPEFDSGSTNLSIGAGSLWVARGKSLVSNLTLFEGSKIDLTKDAGSSILATEISGSTELTMRLSQTAEQSSMLYLGKVTEGAKITLDIATDGIETIDDLEGVRFATIKTLTLQVYLTFKCETRVSSTYRSIFIAMNMRLPMKKMSAGTEQRMAQLLSLVQMSLTIL